ncbi:hypothetical protein SDC9_95632 [bioreactor metagenome]|uniref:Bacterial Pleckstrin homology domain-containing protein n=1 Tax=bioreactor metagenome TaxID=1076179 RepID=A0A645A6U9_9ZZZZ
MHAGMLLITVFCVFSLMGFFNFSAGSEEKYIPLLVLLVYFGAMRSFFSVRFLVTPNSVVAVFPPFRYSIPFSDIRSVETVNDLPLYMGWGIQGRRLVFAGKHAKAVEIRKDRGFFRTIILVSENSDEFRREVEIAAGYSSGYQFF